MFPNLCIMAVPDGDGLDDVAATTPIGCVVAKIDKEAVLLQGKTPQIVQTGYIGMLAVTEAYRRRGIGKALVQKVIKRMKDLGCSSVTLETEGKKCTWGPTWCSSG